MPLSARRAYHRNARKALFPARRSQLGCHALQRVIRDHSSAAPVPFAADLERHVEVQRFDLASVDLSQFEVRLAFAGTEVRRVYVGDRPAQGEPVAQQVADGGEDPVVQRLISGVVGKQQPDEIGGQWVDSQTIQVT